MKNEGAFSLVHSPSLGNTRLRPLAMTSRTSDAEMEGIVAMDTGLVYNFLSKVIIMY